MQNANAIYVGDTAEATGKLDAPVGGDFGLYYLIASVGMLLSIDAAFGIAAWIFANGV